MSCQTISGRKQKKLEASWCTLRSIPGTHDITCIRCDGVGDIEYSMLSEKPGQRFHILQCQPQSLPRPAPESPQPTAQPNVTVGEWVTAVYNANWYVGLVEAVNMSMLTA